MAINPLELNPSLMSDLKGNHKKLLSQFGPTPAETIRCFITTGYAEISHAGSVSTAVCTSNIIESKLTAEDMQQMSKDDRIIFNEVLGTKAVLFHFLLELRGLRSGNMLDGHTIDLSKRVFMLSIRGGANTTNMLIHPSTMTINREIQDLKMLDEYLKELEQVLGDDLMQIIADIHSPNQSQEFINSVSLDSLDAFPSAATPTISSSSSSSSSAPSSSSSSSYPSFTMGVSFSSSSSSSKSVSQTPAPIVTGYTMAIVDASNSSSTSTTVLTHIPSMK